MARDVHHVLVPGDRPEARRAVAGVTVVPEDRSVLAEPGELVVRHAAALVHIGVDEIDVRGHLGSPRGGGE
ncbi:MAG: hypothetical protein ACRDT1_06195 [Micromonosporaceae bacterium]